MKLFFTKKLLNKTILNEDVIEIITNELIENDNRANNIFYLKKKKITFGKHRDKTFGYLLDYHPRYCHWIISNNINPHKNITKELKDFINNRKKRYKIKDLKKKCLIDFDN